MQIQTRRQMLSIAAFGGVILLGGHRALAQRKDAPGAPTHNVLDTMAADGRFDRFIQLIGASGLSDQLRGVGPLTVFAPTGAAFDHASFSRIQELLSQGGSGSGGGGTTAAADPIRLRALVGYHIIQGSALTTAQLAGDRQVQTEAGGVVRIAAQGTGPGAKIVLSNPAPEGQRGTFGVGGINAGEPATLEGPMILATNGIIHPINRVLLP